MNKKIITQIEIDAVSESNLIAFDGVEMQYANFPYLITCASLKNCYLKSVKLPNGCFVKISIDNCTFEDTSFRQGAFSGSIDISMSNTNGLGMPKAISKDLMLYRCSIHGLSLPKVGEYFKILNCDLSLINMTKIDCGRFEITSCDISSKNIECTARTALIDGCNISNASLVLSTDESILVKNSSITNTIIECGKNCARIEFENVTFDDEVRIMARNERCKISFSKCGGSQPDMGWKDKNNG